MLGAWLISAIKFLSLGNVAYRRILKYLDKVSLFCEVQENFLLWKADMDNLYELMEL